MLTCRWHPRQVCDIPVTRHRGSPRLHHVSSRTSPWQVADFLTTSPRHMASGLNPALRWTACKWYQVDIKAMQKQVVRELICRLVLHQWQLTRRTHNMYWMWFSTTGNLVAHLQSCEWPVTVEFCRMVTANDNCVITNLTEATIILHQAHYYPPSQPQWHCHNQIIPLG